MLDHTPTDNGPINLLVVEDDIEDFYITKELLLEDSQNSFRIYNSTSLSAAYNVCDDQSIDLVLLDLDIDDSRGLDTLERLKVRVPDTPIVILTGLNEEKIGLKAIQCGATDYIPKGHISTYLLARAITYGLERNRLLSEIKSQAKKDALTGLPNRAALFQRLSVLIDQSKRNDSKLAMVMVDLDGFKEINDNHGHQVGDQVLIEIANRLNKNLRKSDYAARLAGDEFILLISNYSNREDLIHLLEKKRVKVARPIEIADESEMTLQVSCSFGVAEFQSGQDIKSLIDLADRQLYKSKRGGKNKISFVDSEQN